MLRLLVVAALCSGLASAVQVSVANVAGNAGANMTVNVQFVSQGAQVTGLQFDLEFDPGLTVTATIGSIESSAGKSLSTADLAAGKKRFLLAGLNQNILADGVALSLSVSIPSSATNRQYPLHISSASGTDKDGKSVAVTTADGAVTVGAPAPALAAVVNGGSFLPGIVDGSWVSIQGSNLSGTTRSWQTGEIANGKFPPSLDGVSVTVAGLPASVAYISPTQLNVQVPITGGTGPVNVIVTNNVGATSSVSAPVRRNSPGLFVFSPSGGKYPAALIARADGGVDYLGPAGLFGTALATRPVRPGEILELYGTGLGPTNPAVPAGQVFAGAAPLVDAVAVSIGGVNAPVGFAGLSGAGLYQINVTVPNLSPGEQLVVVNVNGVSSQSGVFVVVGQ